MKKIVILFSIGFITLKVSEAQTNAITQATEFGVPSSGAFTLLGTNPKNVSTPGFTKDIKLDYFFSNGQLNPNIAFEFQPVWLFYFKNVSLDKYKKVPVVLRFLSTANISLGTVKDNDSINRIAYSVKFSFFRDPMTDASYLNGMSRILTDNLNKRADYGEQLSMKKFRYRKALFKLKDLIYNLSEQKKKLKGDSESLEIIQLDDEIQKDSMEMINDSLQMLTIRQQINEYTDKAQDSLDMQLKKFANEYINSNMYKPRMDIGIGGVNTYKNATVTELGLTEQGTGVWINPAVGWYKTKLLFTALLKYIKTDTLNQTYAGGNIQYGGSKVSLFIEYIYDLDNNTTTNSIAYGGSFSIDSQKLIQFGIRTDYNSKFAFKDLVPAVSIDWKLAGKVLD